MEKGLQFLFPVDIQYFNDQLDDLLPGGEPSPAPAGGEPSAEPQPTQPGAEPPANETQPQKPPNSGADFARMRRAMEQQFQSSKEYQLAQKIAQRYGMTPEQLMQRLEEDELAQQAQQMQVSPEVLREQQMLRARIEQMEQAEMLRRAQTEVERFKANPIYANVTEEEIGPALALLGQMHRSGMEDFTLEQAFKITSPNYEARLREQIREQIVQEYAQNGGKAPLPPRGGAAPTTTNSAFDLPDDKFEEMLRRVKSGERITKF